VKDSVILVTGPESSGTRWVTSLLSQHPDLDWFPSGHADPLEDFWEGRTDKIPQGRGVTRRSLPSGASDRGATFLEFDDFSRLINAAKALTVIVTVRSPIPNIVSWAELRTSTKGGNPLAMAQLQYHKAYKHLFEFFIKHDRLQFFLVPFEAFILDGRDAVNSVFTLLKLPFIKYQGRSVSLT